MAKVSMRVDYTLDGLSLEEQIQIAKNVGADAVETGELKGYDCKKAGAAAVKHGIEFVACGFYDIWNARVGAPFEEIKDNLIKTIECAKALGTNKLLSLTIDSVDRGSKAQVKFIENMKPVVELCEKNKMILVLEPHSTIHVNPLVDMSKYFLNTSKLAYHLMDQLDSPNVKMLFDFYHIQTMEGDIMMNVKQHLDRIIHFHIAGVPGRDEPMNGELHYPNLVRFINGLGYENYFGLEYFPADRSDLETLAKTVKYIKNA